MFFVALVAGKINRVIDLGTSSGTVEVYRAKSDCQDGCAFGLRPITDCTNGGLAESGDQILAEKQNSNYVKFPAPIDRGQFAGRQGAYPEQKRRVLCHHLTSDSSRPCVTIQDTRIGPAKQRSRLMQLR